MPRSLHPTPASYVGPAPVLVTALLAVLATLGLSACSAAAGSPSPSTAPSTSAPESSPGDSPDLSSVTLRVGDQVHLLQTLLQASGELNGVAYHLQWDDFSSGPPLLAALTSNDLDLGIVGDTPPVFAAASDESLRLIAASYDDGDRTDAIVVPPGSHISSVAQLKGQKVAVAEGTSANYTLVRALAAAGLTWKDITPVYLQPAEALAALRSGGIAAWAVWYPYVGLAEAEGAHVVTTGASLDPGYGFVASSPQSLANTNTKAAIADFLGRLRQAQLWADAHTATWASDFAKLTGLPGSVALETATVEQHSQYLPITASVESAEQQLADGFSSLGLIKAVKVDDLFDTSFTAALTP